MSIVKHIRDKVCPVCGAIAIHEGFTNYYNDFPAGRVHCNGEQFEFRAFDCGLKIEWIPNFSDQFVKAPCSKSPEEVEKKAKRLIAKSKITAYIQKLDVDEGFKKSLLDSHPLRL